jgi:hypothetical protein
VLLGIIVLLILIVNEPQIVGFTLALLYVLHGPVLSLILWRRRRAAQSPASAADLPAESHADPSEETGSNPARKL